MGSFYYVLIVVTSFSSIWISQSRDYKYVIFLKTHMIYVRLKGQKTTLEEDSTQTIG